MNERIRELAEQAGITMFGDAVYMSNRNDTLDVNVMEKFGELIVQECIEWCDAHATINGTAQQVAESIKNYFGVEK